MLRMHKSICEIEKGKLTKNKCAKNTYEMIIQIFQINGRMHIINRIGTLYLYKMWVGQEISKLAPNLEYNEV